MATTQDQAQWLEQAKSLATQPAAPAAPVDPQQWLAQSQQLAQKQDWLAQSQALSKAFEKFDTQTPDQLAKDYQFSPEEFYDAHESLLDNPKIDKLAEIRRLRNAAGITPGAVAEGLSKVPSAVGQFAKGFYKAAESATPNSIEREFAHQMHEGADAIDAAKMTAKKKVAEFLAGAEGMSAGMGGLVRSGVRKAVNAFTPKMPGQDDFKADVYDVVSGRPGEFFSTENNRDRFLADAGIRKQQRNIGEGKGEYAEATGLDAESLAKEGIKLDPEVIQGWSQATDPTLWVPMLSGLKAVAVARGGFAVVNGAGKTVATAASRNLAEKFIQNAAQKVAQGAAAMDAKLATKSALGPAAVTAGIEALSGHVGVPGLVSSLGTKMALRGGLKAVEGAAKVAGSDAALDIYGAVGRGGASGAAFGLPFAAAQDNPEQQVETVGVGAALGAAGGAAHLGATKTAQGLLRARQHVISTLYKTAGDLQPVQDFSLNTNPALEAQHADMLAKLKEASPNDANILNRLRALMAKDGVESYLLSPEQAEQLNPVLRGKLGKAEVPLPNGGKGLIWILGPEGMKSLTHEPGHFIDNFVLSAEEKAALTEAISPEFQKQFNDYYLSMPGLTEGQRNTYASNPGLLQAELRAEIIGHALEGNRLDNVPPSIRQKFYGVLGRTLERVGLYEPGLAAPSSGPEVSRFGTKQSPIASNVAEQIVRRWLEDPQVSETIQDLQRPPVIKPGEEGGAGGTPAPVEPTVPKGPAPTAITPEHGKVFDTLGAKQPASKRMLDGIRRKLEAGEELTPEEQGVWQQVQDLAKDPAFTRNESSKVVVPKVVETLTDEFDIKPAAPKGEQLDLPIEPANPVAEVEVKPRLSEEEAQQVREYGKKTREKLEAELREELGKLGGSLPDGWRVDHVGENTHLRDGTYTISGFRPDGSSFYVPDWHPSESLETRANQPQGRQRKPRVTPPPAEEVKPVESSAKPVEPKPQPSNPEPRNLRGIGGKDYQFFTGAGRSKDETGLTEAQAAVDKDASLTPEQKTAFSTLADNTRRPVQVTYRSAETEGDMSRTARRAEIEAGRDGGPRIEEGVNKVAIPVAFRTTKEGKAQIQLYSPDKDLANARDVVSQANKKRASHLIPYETKNGQFTEKGLDQFNSDLEAYNANQDNGYRGDGLPLNRPEGYEGFIPEPNPDYIPVKLPKERMQFLNLVKAIAPPKSAREVVVQGKAKYPANLRAQDLNRAQTPPNDAVRPTLFPGKKGDVPVQAYKSFGGREIAELNTLRKRLDEAGVNTRELTETTEWINAHDVLDVKPLPENRLRPNVVDTTAAGFMPEGNPQDPIVRVAVREKGRVYEGFLHSSIREANRLRGGEDGFVTRSGKFLNREEALRVAEEHSQVAPQQYEDESVRGKLDSGYVDLAEPNFMPASERREIEIVGPDQKKYRATFDGWQDMRLIGRGMQPQITAIDDIPGVTGAKSTTYGSSLEGKGYKLPELGEANFMPARTEAGKKLEAEGYNIVSVTDPKTKIRFLSLRDKNYKSVSELSYFIDGNNHAKIANVSTDKDFRRRGFAEALYREVLATLQGEGVKRLRGDVVDQAPLRIRRKVLGADERALGDGGVLSVSDKIPQDAHFLPSKFWFGQKGGIERVERDHAEKLGGTDREAAVQSKLNTGALRAVVDGDTLFLDGNKIDFSQLPRTQREKLEDLAVERGLALNYNGEFVDDFGAAFMPVTSKTEQVKGGNDEVRKLAADYMRESGLPYQQHRDNVEVNETLAKKIADAYESAAHRPSDREVQKAYHDFSRETVDQWNAITRSGVKMEPWTEEGFGSKEADANHPLLKPSGIKVNGRELPINDVFRAVHDFFGHAKEGYEFGPRGELNAFITHARMFSESARPAMAAETLGQNSWVNFGKHLRDRNGNIAKRGEPGYVPLTKRPFAEQKATVLPDELVRAALGEENAEGAEFLPAKKVVDEAVRENEKKSRGVVVRPAPKGGKLADAVGGKLEVVHYSQRPGLTELSPEYMGKAQATADDARGLNKVFLFLKGSPFGGDQGRFDRRYAYRTLVDGSKIYDTRGEDPLGYFTGNREKAESNIKRAGYTGALVEASDGRQVIVSFDPVKVEPIGFASQAGRNAVGPVKLREGLEEAIRAKGKVFTRKQLDRMDGFSDANKLERKGVLKMERDYGDEGYPIEEGFVDKKGKWVEASKAYEPEQAEADFMPSGVKFETSRKKDRVVVRAVLDGKTVGHIEGKLEGSTVDVRHIEVEDAHQRKGIGGELYKTLAREAKKLGATTMTGAAGPDARGARVKALGKPVRDDVIPEWEDAWELHHDISQFMPSAKQEDLFGDSLKPVVRDVRQMSAAELKKQFPEAVVPTDRSKVAYGFENAPLVKGLKTEEQKVAKFADALVSDAKRWEDLPEFQSGLNWYSEFVPKLKKFFGKDTQLFAELLAATSPRTNPGVNFGYATKAFEGWLRGEYDGQVKKFNEGWKKLEDGSLEKWFKQRVPKDEWPEKIQAGHLIGEWVSAHDLVPTQWDRYTEFGDKKEVKFGMHGERILRVLSRRWLNTNQGPKVNQFVRNLTGENHGATIDVWASRTLRRLGFDVDGKRWRIMPEFEQAVTDSEFAFGQKVFAAAAEKLGVEPSALQGGMWFAEKKYWDTHGWQRLDLGDFRRELDDFVTERKLEKAQGKLFDAPKSINRVTIGDVPIRKADKRTLDLFDIKPKS